MGRQVNFYVTPADVAAMERSISRNEAMAVVAWTSPTAEPLVSCFPSTPGARCWLLRVSDLGAVVTRHVPEQGHWLVDVFSSPVVEFSSCDFDGVALRSGRVYYMDGYYGPDGQWLEKPAAFRKWAEGVLRSVRKTLKRHGSDWVGADVAWLKTGDGKLVAV